MEERDLEWCDTIVSGRSVVVVRDGKYGISSGRWSRGSIEDLEEARLMESGSCRIVCIVSCRSREDKRAVIRATSDSLRLSVCLSLREHSFSAVRSAVSVA